MLNNTVFKVDDSYLTAPDDQLIPLIGLDGNPVGTINAVTLRQMTWVVPECYQELFQKRVHAKALEEYKSIDIRSVLRLAVHNERYIHYLVGPVLMDDLLIREGGQYFAFVNVDNNVPVLFTGNTGLELDLNIKHGIPAERNLRFTVLHDSYLEEALAKLLASHNLANPCSPSELVSVWKDPLSVVAPIGGEQANHAPHCEWCLSQGLNGLHDWNNDGSVHDDGSTTTNSYYGRM